METHRTSPLPADKVPADKVLVLFDGECHLCNGAVQFLIARDAHDRFRFAPLQGESGRRACAAMGLELPEGVNPGTIVVIEGGVGMVRSDAVLAIAAQLPFPWSLLAVGRAVPRPVRDALYRWVARNRYRWFGRSATCLVPSPRIRDRFLE